LDGVFSGARVDVAAELVPIGDHEGLALCLLHASSGGVAGVAVVFMVVVGAARVPGKGVALFGVAAPLAVKVKVGCMHTARFGYGGHGCLFGVEVIVVARNILCG
jgi:hypothetical protein